MLAALSLAVAAQAAPAETAGEAVVGLIIDDMGNRRADGLRALELRGPVTYAFLPHTPYADRLATLAGQLGKEVMLHLPMEASTRRRLGPGGITRAMDRETVRRTVAASLRAVPGVRGVNNHMGSALTRESDHMRWVMETLREHGGLYFVDSRTTRSSVAQRVASGAGLATVARDVFLDADPDPRSIRNQFRLLLARARTDGSALGIGHPYPETLAVLERELGGLEANGVRLVPVSELIEHRQAGWRAPVSQARLQPVAERRPAPAN